MRDLRLDHDPKRRLLQLRQLRRDERLRMSEDYTPLVPQAAEDESTRNEILASLEVIERTDHKRCANCRRFVPKDRWTPKLKDQRKDPNARIVGPPCDGCYQEYDPPRVVAEQTGNVRNSPTAARSGTRLERRNP